MQLISNFWKVILVWAVIMVLVKVFYWFKSRNDLSHSDFDKAFVDLRCFTYFLGGVIAIAMLFLPSAGFYSEIDISASERETAFQNLVRNQQRMGEQLERLREILYIVFLILMFYFFGVAGLMSRIWQERQRLAALDKPETKKPLGLESN